MRTAPLPVEPDASDAPVGSRRPVLVVVSTLVSAWVLAAATMRHRALGTETLPTPAFPRNRWLDAWVRWDAGWYETIARHGYSYRPGQQSSIAFFPSYPLLMRWLGAAIGNVFVAGILITVVSGVSYLLLAARWFRDHLGPTAAWSAFLLLCWYPFAVYLFGAVYSDALFALAALGAFMLVEREKPILAGIVGAVAAAARPVGVAVVVGLVIFVIQQRGVLERRPRWRLHLGNLAWRDFGVLISIVGLGAYLGYLAIRFGNPVAFLDAEAGWDQAPGYETWLKFPLLRALRHGQEATWLWRHGMHLAAGILALALLPRVWKRFGSAYGVYALIVIAVPMISTKDFFSTGRYMLPAFPCFGAAGDLLATRPRTRVAVLATSACLLAVYVVLYARGNYVA